MRNSIYFFPVIVFLLLVSGCQKLDYQKELLIVDFQPNSQLRYKFVSDREITVNLDPTGKLSKSGKSTDQKMTERMELVMAYTTVDIDSYGLATIEAKCESVKVNRKQLSGRPGRGKDAVEYLAGKTFRLKVLPSGAIEDRSQLEQLIAELGDRAFGAGKSDSRIKNPDMISDFIATQWFLWDAISSIKKPLSGVKPGQSWSSRLNLPLPMLTQAARDTTYTLDAINQTEEGKVAVISSEYSLAKKEKYPWPIPYSGRFQVRGIFGFLRGYKILSLEGTAKQLFNIDSGLIQKDVQQYEVQISASMFALGGSSASPNIKVKQKISMQLLQN